MNDLASLCIGGIFIIFAAVFLAFVFYACRRPNEDQRDDRKRSDSGPVQKSASSEWSRAFIVAFPLFMGIAYLIQHLIP